MRPSTILDLRIWLQMDVASILFVKRIVSPMQPIFIFLSCVSSMQCVIIYVVFPSVSLYHEMTIYNKSLEH